MNDEELYLICEKLECYINPKEKKQAIEEFLMVVYDNGGNVYTLMKVADETGDSDFVKVAKRFIKENGIDEEDW